MLITRALRNSTKCGAAIFAVTVLLVSGIGQPASATNLGTSIYTNTNHVIKNKPITLTANGIVTMTKTGDLWSSHSTYFIYVEFWQKGDFGQKFVNMCSTSADVTSAHFSSGYKCSIITIPSKDLTSKTVKKDVTYFAKIT